MKKVLSCAIIIFRLLLPILWSVGLIATAIFFGVRGMAIFIPVLLILNVWVNRIGKLDSEYIEKNLDGGSLKSTKSDNMNRAYSIIKKIPQASEKEQVPSCLALLVGMEILKIPHYNEYGHDYESVIDAIHVYCEKNTDKGMDQIYKKAIYRIIDSLFLKKVGYSLGFDILSHELEKIMNHTCAFDVDILEYTQYMKNKVDEKISNGDEIEEGFEEWFANRKERLERTYKEVKDIY